MPLALWVMSLCLVFQIIHCDAKLLKHLVHIDHPASLCAPSLVGDGLIYTSLEVLILVRDNSSRNNSQIAL
jgi:hypothetical protein